MNNETLHNVRTSRYLGVDIDHTLSFNAMVNNVYTKTNQNLYSVKLTQPFICTYQTASPTISLSFVYAQLSDYGVPIPTF